MRVVFMGTPEFALPSLHQIYQSEHTVVAVVTAPDRPRGRGHRMSPTPIAQTAARFDLPILKYATLKEPQHVQELAELSPDVIVVVAFGLLLPPDVLELPAKGCVNLHPSLLPRHRGASPIQAPLLAGEAQTGVTTMYMDAGLDSGDIILQRTVEIPPEAHAGDMHDHLAVEGAKLLAETLEQVGRGSAPRIPQDHELATYAPKVEKTSVPWDEPADSIVRTIRGLSPFPGVHTHWSEKRLKILRARAIPGAFPGEAGTFARVSYESLTVKAGQGGVELIEVHLAGKKPMSAAEFVRGFSPRVASAYLDKACENRVF